MGKTHQISKEEAATIKEYRKKIKDKLTDRRLYAVQLRAQGIRNKDVAERLEVNPKQVSQWCSLYIKGGIEALLPHPRSGRPPKLTYEQEEAILQQFIEKAEAGQIIETSEIRAAYEAAAGKSKGHGQIYLVLHRHGWRKIKPRSRHPKKASPEAIEASKKLKLK
ncbi:MAG: helix-turn-helix domain-containing protein [Ruminococcus sp.]|nr:helix-turn-helix domain-containing protein [Ruminococcus sp.]